MLVSGFDIRAFGFSLDQLDFLALFQRDDRFFPMRLASIIGAAFALFFARVIAGVNIDNLLLEQTLDCVFDLDLVRARADPEDVLVLLLAHERRFLGQRCSLDDVVGLVHFITP
jgi:hypothetical protein